MFPFRKRPEMSSQPRGWARLARRLSCGTVEFLGFFVEADGARFAVLRIEEDEPLMSFQSDDRIVRGRQTMRMTGAFPLSQSSMSAASQENEERCAGFGLEFSGSCFDLNFDYSVRRGPRRCFDASSDDAVDS